MVALGFGQFADSVSEIKSFTKVFKFEFFFNMVFIYNFPIT